MHTYTRIFFCTMAFLFFTFPTLAYAALVNINTADATTLDGLPYISLSVAESIVQYRTTNGPFVRIEDIQNVNGIKSGIFSHIQSLITVGDTSTSTADASSTPTDTTIATSTITTAAVVSSGSSSGPGEYLPIPTLRVVTSGDRTVSSGADTAFTAAVYDNKGNKRDDAVVTWSFGDGMQKVGANVFHEYYDPGEYVAIVHASTPDGGDIRDEMIITAKDASIKISSISSRGIALVNNDSRTLDLSLWRISAGGQEFKIPENTEILAGHTILFPSQVTELPSAGSATLLYPSGEVAATYGAGALAQPSSVATSYERVQAVEPPVVSKVEPIISTRTTVQSHENAVSAPAVATELAAAGAALPVSTSTPNPVSKLMKSPWTIGSLGVVILTGAAFILL